MVVTCSSGNSGSLRIPTTRTCSTGSCNSITASFSDSAPATCRIRALIERLPSPLSIWSVFQSCADSIIAAETCSAVTIEVGDRNHAVPLIPAMSARGVGSPASKYRAMLTVDCASCIGSTQSAFTTFVHGSRMQATSSQNPTRPRIAAKSPSLSHWDEIRVKGQYEGSTYPEGFRWTLHFREQCDAFSTVRSPCPLDNRSVSTNARRQYCSSLAFERPALAQLCCELRPAAAARDEVGKRNPLHAPIGAVRLCVRQLFR